jgi:cholesterol transport system auxiliary component
VIATKSTFLFRTVFAGALLLTLTGCLSGGGGRVQTYSPQVSVEARPEWPSAKWALLIGRPLTSEALDTSNIAVRPVPGALQSYADAQWADATPEMLQTALVQGFEDSGKIDSIGRQGTGLHGDFSLLLELRHFESVYTDPAQPPSVQIEVQAKLIASASGRVVAAKTFRVSAPARDKEVPQVVAAFQAAMTDTVDQLVGWTLVTGQANAPPAAPIH